MKNYNLIKNMPEYTEFVLKEEIERLNITDLTKKILTDPKYQDEAIISIWLARKIPVYVLISAIKFKLELEKKGDCCDFLNLDLLLDSLTKACYEDKTGVRDSSYFHAFLDELPSISTSLFLALAKYANLSLSEILANIMFKVDIEHATQEQLVFIIRKLQQEKASLYQPPDLNNPYSSKYAFRDFPDFHPWTETCWSRG
jgi:hypothetical protein